jgi:hypothetical protein
MSINRQWDEIDKMFKLRGFVNGDWQPFEKGVNYTSFLLQTR